MKALAEQIAELDEVEIYGRVVSVRGLMVEVAGPIHAMSVGARVIIDTGGGRSIPCEVVGFTGSNALLMPFAPLEGVRRGCKALVTSVQAAARPCAPWLGRVVNAMGGPVDDPRLQTHPPYQHLARLRDRRHGLRGGSLGSPSRREFP